MRTKQMLVFLALFVAALAPLLAEDDVEEEPLWNGSLGFSYLATTGNTETESLGLDLKIDRRALPWGVLIEGRFTRAEENNLLTAERYYLSGRALRTVTERWDVFAGLSGERDEFAGFELRSIISFGGEWIAWVGSTHLLDFDLGLTWTDESRILESEDTSFLGALLGLDYEWKISGSASITQSIDYFHNFDDPSDWRVNSDTGLQTKILEKLALKVSYEIRYRNQPINLLERTDTTAKASLVLRF